VLGYQGGGREVSWVIRWPSAGSAFRDCRCAGRAAGKPCRCAKRR